MSSNIVFDRVLTMTAIGKKADDCCGSAPSSKPIFVCADLLIICGFTGGGLLSIGHNGFDKIDTFELCEHSIKADVEGWFKIKVMEVEDFYPIEYLNEDHVITSAVVNNIFKKLRVAKCWIHCSWQLEELGKKR
jgi:hypothetical protein